MPPRALVNDLWEGPLPDELQDLSVAEKLMIARAFTFTQLHTCTRKGNPSDRQKRIQGNTISFAQDAALLLLDALPLHPSKLGDFLVLYFTDEDYKTSRYSRQYTVRRQKVQDALMWLRLHNPFYADISVDKDILASLPEDGIPPELEERIMCSEAHTPSLQQCGPADASFQGSSDSTTDTTYPFRAAVIDVEGEGINPVSLWNAALTGREKS